MNDNDNDNDDDGDDDYDSDDNDDEGIEIFLCLTSWSDVPSREQRIGK